jgi:hypothetical protein
MKKRAVKKIEKKVEKRVEKRTMSVIILAGIIILAGLFLISNQTITGRAFLNRNSTNALEKIQVTKDNLAEVLSNQEIIKELPEKAVILLKLYNFNIGIRQWEESYVIKKGNVIIGPVDNPDITIILHSKYIPMMGDWCSAVKKASANKDIGYETKMSDASLLWKYGKLWKYKSCLS